MGTEDYVFIGGDDPAFNDAGGRTKKKSAEKEGKYHCVHCGTIYTSSKAVCCDAAVVKIGICTH